MDRVRTVTEKITNDEQEGFRSGRCCINEIFTQKKLDIIPLEKKYGLYDGCIGLEKAYNT